MRSIYNLFLFAQNLAKKIEKSHHPTIKSPK